MSKFYQRVIVLFLFASLTGCGGLKSDDLESKKQTDLELYLTAKDAYNLLNRGGNNIMFDVRTRAEAKEGMPSFAINVPILIREEEQNKVVPNKKFVSTIIRELEDKGLDEQTTILMISNQGKLSARAVNTLAKKRYRKVYNVVDGVIGWKKNELPLSYDVDAKESS
ncbi:MAG: rhodanese-like domain-containing protein [Pseudomonadota bacterium]